MTLLEVRRNRREYVSLDCMTQRTFCIRSVDALDDVDFAEVDLKGNGLWNAVMYTISRNPTSFNVCELLGLGMTSVRFFLWHSVVTFIAFAHS